MQCCENPVYHSNVDDLLGPLREVVRGMLWDAGPDAAPSCDTLKVVYRSQSKADEVDPSEIDPVRGKAVYLDLIKKQSQEMVELGLLGSPSREWLGTTESQMEELDLSLLQAISQSAGDLLIKAAAQRAQ